MNALLFGPDSAGDRNPILNNHLSVFNPTSYATCFGTRSEVLYWGPGETRCMKILLIDDHVLIREALQGIFKELRPDTTVLEAENCGQAVRLAEEHADLEVILLDLNLPDGDGFHLLADLRKLYPAVSIIVLSASNDRNNVIRALDLGAVGFIPKSA